MMKGIPKITELCDIERSIAAPLLKGYAYPHELLPNIGRLIEELIPKLEGFKEISDGVFAADGARIWDGATIVGPTVIDSGAEIRPGAFIRGNAIIGGGAVIGNSTEVKNAIIFDGAQLPHYNYVGDSIIGCKAHMGAGAIASNLRLDKKEIVLKSPSGEYPTGLRKFGAILGDGAEVGCGCVLCPGTVIGRGAVVYPLLTVKGIIPEKHIYNGKDTRQIGCLKGEI